MHLNKKFILLGLLLAVVAIASQPGGKRTLVIIESPTVKTTHSNFFKNLESKGYKLDFHAEDETVQFRTYGEWNYDHLILFAPSAAELPSGITVRSVLEFIDDGHNALIVGGPEIGKPIADIASDCNVEFDEEGTFVIDHLSFDAADAGQHTLLAVSSDNVIKSPVVFPKPVKAPILFKGIGQDIQEDSALLFCVLKGNPTTYSYVPGEKIEDLHVAGSKTCLVSALQARNNARVVFAGSLELFSDAYANAAVSTDTGAKSPKSGNDEFTSQLTQWLLQERGILRATNVKHHRAGETEAPFTYRIKDDVEYQVDIQEWNGEKWVPFTASDVQLEFRMLDPYVRTTMKSDKNGRYTASFKLPDVYGVFTFKIEYVRLGYGFLTDVTRTPVRPFRHNEYERFISSAFPYYTSAFSMMAGLFLFSWFFLYHRETAKV